LTPALVVYEHPTAELSPADHARIAEQCRVVASARHIASVVLTADRDFAKAAADRVLSLEASSGWLSRFRRA
jgi:ABC-type arginine transport system ATPase subunit